MKIALAALLALTPVSALAGEYQAGYSNQRSGTTYCVNEYFSGIIGL